MKKSELTVALCFNMHPTDDELKYDEKFAEWDSYDTITTISNSLKEIGYNVELIEFNADFVENLKRIKPDLVFNIVEGFQGEDRESQAPAIYEYLGIPYTGSTPLAHGIALDKVKCKQVLDASGVKTAPYVVYNKPINGIIDFKLKFPAIVKPIHEGSSIGIHNSSIVRSYDQLKSKVNEVISTYKQPALVEKFIKGREFNQAIIGNEDPILFPIVEIDYSNLPEHIEKFSSFEVKNELDDPDSTICPARITKEEEKRICEATLASYRAADIRDYCRIDLRMDENGDVYILEINSIPGIAPGIEENNSMPKAIRTYGWTYTDMVKAIVDAALLRYNINVQ